MRLSRKNWIGLTAGLLSGMLVLTAGGCAPPLQRFSTSFLDVFDTASTIVGYTVDQQTFDQQADDYHDLLERYNQLYDIYNEYDGINNLKTVNDNAGIAPVTVDQEIIDLLLFGKEIYEFSDGRVNICFGSVLEIWHDYREDGLNHPEKAELPPVDLLQQAAEHTDIDSLVIDQQASTVYLEDSEMRLDVGAIAKGYAVAQATKTIVEDGMENAAFSIGGNVSTVGWKEGKEGNNWIIGLENPDRTAEDYLLTVSISDRSVVTSGNYQRYYTVDGKQYHHIIDPDTLMPAEYMQAVSVIAEDSGFADGLSTMLFLMPVEDGLELVEGMDGVEALWVDMDGTVVTSSGFDQYIND